MLQDRSDGPLATRNGCRSIAAVLGTIRLSEGRGWLETILRPLWGRERAFALNGLVTDHSSGVLWRSSRRHDDSLARVGPRCEHRRHVQQKTGRPSPGGRR